MVILMKKVSIIVPAYNCEKYIQKCIDSILKQTYSNIEIIIINDGSSDNTLNILEHISRQDSRVRILNELNGGVSSARNKGLNIASGDYIIFIDSDDFVKRDYVEQLILKAQQSGENTVYTGYSILNYKKGKREIINYIPSIESLTGYAELDNHFNELMDKRFILSPIAKLFDASIIKNNNIRFDESVKIGEDLLFNLQYLVFVDTIVFIKKSFYYYVMSSQNSLSKSFDVSRSENSKKLYLKGIEFCYNKQLGEKSRAAMANYYFKSQMILIESLMKKREHNTNIIIKHILNDNVTRKALNECRNNKIELMIYYVIWKNKSVFLIKALGIIRILLKHIRGF